MITPTATLDVSVELARCVAWLLFGECCRRGTRAGTRVLTCFPAGWRSRTAANTRGGVGALRGACAHQPGVGQPDQCALQQAVDVITPDTALANLGQHAVWQAGIVGTPGHRIARVLRRGHTAGDRARDGVVTMTTSTKRDVAARIRAAEADLLGLSYRIHAHPELAFEETLASEWVAEALDAGGFDVEYGCYELPTAIRATVGNGPCHVVVCAEYDALPDMGHACGHNIIAAELNNRPRALLNFRTPAEVYAEAHQTVMQ